LSPIKGLRPYEHGLPQLGIEVEFRKYSIGERGGTSTNYNAQRIACGYVAHVMSVPLQAKVALADGRARKPGKGLEQFEFERESPRPQLVTGKGATAQSKKNPMRGCQSRGRDRSKGR